VKGNGQAVALPLLVMLFHFWSLENSLNFEISEGNPTGQTAVISVSIFIFLGSDALPPPPLPFFAESPKSLKRDVAHHGSLLC
jgi:hypothetical protein